MLDAEDIFFIFVIANFALGFLFIGTQLYFGYFRMNEILRNLSNSRGVELRRSIMGRDPLTRFFMLISVGAMLTFHQRSIKGGDLDAEDYKHFPRSLHQMIKLSYMSALFGGALLFVLWAIGKYMGWLK
ncbi:hypothetical protein [Pseudomonas sp. RA_35y_Pfl2_P32]|uniref:hypothetical protein n=1 Tax=Pseudomonas sp. RA_35y_Pfl2_P32 TaxID=3088705 RepID=UPI0030DD5C72